MRKLTVRYVCLLGICLLEFFHGFAQTDTTIRFVFGGKEDSLNLIDILKYQSSKTKGYDTILFRQQICKSFFVLRYRIVDRSREERRNVRAVLPAKIDEPFLKINGAIQYDYLYRSYVDTPFTQNDFQQHTVQSSLNVLVKNRYPVRFNFSTQQNNSPYFNNLYNINLRFDPNTYLVTAKQKALQRIEKLQSEVPDLTAAETILLAEQEKLAGIKARLSQPDLLQLIIQEREKKYFSSLAKPNTQNLEKPIQDSLGSLTLADTNFSIDSGLRFRQDSIAALMNIDSVVSTWKATADSLQDCVKKLQNRFDSLKQIANKNWNLIRQSLYNAKNIQQLEKIESESGLALERKSGVENILSNVRSVGLGRSVINYSELTAWNVLLTGLNVEWSSKRYAAFAIGKIDYGFRDFFGRHNSQKDQNFVIGRFGVGNPDSKALIVSLFAGRKYSYGSVVADTISGFTNIVGYSIQGILKSNDNTGMELEVAKTTKPLSGRLADNGAMKGLSTLNDFTNLGVSLKAQTFFKKTNTRISAFYRKTGQNFQSFSLFTYNVDQTSWNLKAEQCLLKDKVAVTAMLRRNDFVNPFTDKTFKTNTVFKSLQLNIRVPKFPNVSLGYYPGSQSYVVNKERLKENVYYILNGTIVHNYGVGGTKMVSAITYNQFSNKGTDSGFIAYSGTSYMITQTMVSRKFQLQGSYVFTDQEAMKYQTWETAGSYTLNRVFQIGGGAKYHKIVRGEAFWGRRAYLSVDVKKLGRLQLQYEKSYLPTVGSTLFPIETGRATWIKTF